MIYEVFNGKCFDQWKEVMKFKYLWKLVFLFEGKNIVGFCQVLKVKYNEDGFIDYFKVRFVV